MYSPMMAISIMDMKGGNSDTKVIWNNCVYLFILWGILQSLQIKECMINNRMWSLLVWLGVGSNLAWDRGPVPVKVQAYLTAAQQSNPWNSHTIPTCIVRNGIYCLLHLLLSSFSMERVYPAQPGPVLEFFKYPDLSRFCKNATRSTLNCHCKCYFWWKYIGPTMAHDVYGWQNSDLSFHAFSKCF